MMTEESFMNRYPIYARIDTKAVVDSASVISGGRAQDYGLSPWSDHICVDATTGTQCDPWDAQGADRADVRFVEVAVSLPQGSEGDRCQMEVHGGSGSYQTWHEFRDGHWEEQSTTVPWQLSA